MDSPMEAMCSLTGATHSSPQGSPWIQMYFQANQWLLQGSQWLPERNQWISQAGRKHPQGSLQNFRGNKRFGNHRESFRRVMDASRKAMGSIRQFVDPSITYNVMDSLRKPMYSYRKSPDDPRNLMHSLRITWEINGCLEGSRDS